MMCTDDGDGGIDAIVSMMPLLIGYRRPHLLPSRRSVRSLNDTMVSVVGGGLVPSGI